MRRLAATVALVAAGCTGGSAVETTTSVAPTSTAPTSTTEAITTTTTEPLVENGPAIVGEGDRNETVAAVQLLLNCNGYGELTVDGVYGPNTQSAIEALQRDLGRVVTGGIDDAAFAELARNCDTTRRVAFDDGTQAVVVGNTAAPDPDGYFVQVEEGTTLTVTVASVTGGARVAVSGVDGASFGLPLGTVWASEVPTTQDYLVEVTTNGEATRYEAVISIVDLDDRGTISAADEGTVEVGDLDEAVSQVCRDTSGEDAFVADTPSAHLVVAAGSPGERGIDLGGIGAPVEVVMKDGSPGWYGFAMDLEVEVGDDVTGTARVFSLERGSHTDEVDLAFDFAVSVAPCSGDAATSVVLSSSGLGVVDFGATDVEAAILTAQDALPGSSAPDDTGWFDIDPEANDFGVCRGSMTEARVVTVDNLTIYFADGGTGFGSAGSRHLVAWEASEGLFPLATGSGVGPGSTIAEVLAAHPDATVVAVTGGARVYVSSAPGSDAWLWAEAPDADGADDTGAVVTTFHGGRFCDG